MKRKFKVLAMILCLTILFSCFTFIKPSLSSALDDENEPTETNNINENENNQENENNENNENNNEPVIEKIDKVEIIDSNISLKVGEKPAFTAKIKDNTYGIKLDQTLISKPDHSSTISTDENGYYDDGLIKNFKYEYFIELKIENDENLQFDEDNIKIIVDGKEYDDFAIVDSDFKMLYVYMEDSITPEGYVEPAILDEDVEEEQIKKVEEIVLKDIMEGKVKYKDIFVFNAEDTKNLVAQAIENGSKINIEIYVTSALPISITPYYYNENNKDILDNINKEITENQKVGAYYDVLIIVYIDGDMAGLISELATPVSVTIPTPNGLPKVAEGYERVWKVIRNHDGVAEVLDAKQTENGICFTNDKFSEFAAVYEDVEIEKIADKTTNNPKTGDNITTWIILSIVSTILVSGTLIYKNYIKIKQ